VENLNNDHPKPAYACRTYCMSGTNNLLPLNNEQMEDRNIEQCLFLSVLSLTAIIYWYRFLTQWISCINGN